MKFAIIAPSISPSMELVSKELEIRKIEYDFISAPVMELSNIVGSDFVKKLLEYDLVYFREGLDLATKQTVLSFCQKQGVAVVPDIYITNPIIGDKRYQIAALSVIKNRDFALPKSLSLHNKRPIWSEIEPKLGAQVVIKRVKSAKGVGVFLAKNETEYNIICSENTKESLLAQEFIENDGDYRVFVVNGKAVYAMHRSPKGDDFRSNISLGGEGAWVQDDRITDQLYPIAEKIAIIFGLHIVGVDLMISKKSGIIYFIEINSIPQWEGASKIVQTPIAPVIVDFLEQVCQNKRQSNQKTLRQRIQVGKPITSP